MFFQPVMEIIVEIPSEYISTAVVVNYQNRLPKKLVKYLFVDLLKSPTGHGPR